MRLIRKIILAAQYGIGCMAKETNSTQYRQIMPHVKVDAHNRFIFSWGSTTYFKKIQGNAHRVNINQKTYSSHSYASTQNVHIPGSFTTGGDYAMGSSVNVPTTTTKLTYSWQSTFDIMQDGKRVLSFSSAGRLKKIREGDLVTLVQCYVPDSQNFDTNWNCYLYNHRTKKGEFLVESKQTLGISADEPLVILKVIIAALVVYVIGSACSNFDDEAMHIITNVIYIIAGLLGAIATYSLIRSLIAAKRESVLSQLMKKYLMDQLDLNLV